MLNKQAEELNTTIRTGNPVIYNLLSERGRALFFPKEGILGQSSQAKGKKYNATIGIALENDGSPIRLSSVASLVSLPPKDIFPYAPSYGKEELRKRWKELIYEKNPSLMGEVSLPIVTQALTHGLTLLGYLFLNPGDEVILTDLFWGNYRLIFEVGCGARLSLFHTFTKTGFDLNSFEEKLAEKKGKKVILLNFPNNPAGYTPTKEEAKKIIDIIKKVADEGNELVVILDDAYFGLVYEKDVYSESLFATLSHIHKNILAVKLDGATKEDYVWGLRVGFITYGIKGGKTNVYEALEAKTAGAVRGTISNASHLSQSLLLAAFTSATYEKEKQEKYRLLQLRYRECKKVLQDTKYASSFSPLPYNSGYFMCVKLVEGIDGEEVRKILLEKYDTGVIAMGSLLRIAFSSLPKEQIPIVFENIYKACKECRK